MTSQFCEHCGTPRISHYKFCTGCGTPFEGLDSQTSVRDDELGELEPLSESDISLDGSAEEVVSEGYKSSVLPKVLILSLFALLVGGGGWLLWQQSVGDEVTVVVIGPANVRDMPTAEGSKVVGRLEAGDKLKGHWVESANDPEVKWLEISGFDETRYVWSGNLDVIGASNAADTSPPAKLELSDQIVGRWRCSSTIMGMTEVQLTNYKADGSFSGRSTISGTLEGQRLSGNADYFGTWSIDDQVLIERNESYELSNFQWSNPLLDALVISQFEETHSGSTHSAKIEMGQDRMQLMYEADGLLVPIDCNRATS